jgi:hypothetical protein
MTKGGAQIQGGAFAATLANIEAYNMGDRGVVEDDMKNVIPLLFRSGLFKLFPPEEWASDLNEGRNLIGKLAKKYQESLKESK